LFFACWIKKKKRQPDKKDWRLETVDLGGSYLLYHRSNRKFETPLNCSLCHKNNSLVSVRYKSNDPAKHALVIS